MDTKVDVDTKVDAPELFEPVSIDVDTAKVKKSTIYNIATYNAQVIPTISEVSFGASGTVGEINVKVGDQVTKGQKLGVLSEGEHQNNIEASEEALALSQKNNAMSNKSKEFDITIMKEELKQLRKELKEGKEEDKKKQLQQQINEKSSDIIIEKKKLKDEIELQELSDQKAQTDLAELKSHDNVYEIIAPMDGRVAVILSFVGEMVQLGQTVLVIADNSTPLIRSDFVNDNIISDATNYYALYKGNEIKVEAIPYDQAEYTAMIENEEVVYSYYNLPDNSSGLAVGDFMNVCFITDFAEDALVIPTNALYKDADSKYVYLMNGVSKVRKEISVGTTTPAYAQVTDGLQEGDVVYVQK